MRCFAGGDFLLLLLLFFLLKLPILVLLVSLIRHHCNSCHGGEHDMDDFD
jgi:hypothetical protein